jgi:exopolyphosphatase / guanosine-5'-triphosphate,3'-diphosphate pyrophosphatase
MEAIRPRWEWRTFGSSFGPAEDAFGRLTPERVQESDEIYLVSTDGDTVKVRDELMDVKVLREVDANGLEQWTPVMKAEFPVSAADVGRVFEALRLPLPTLDRAEYTFDQLLDEVIAPADGVDAVQVHKRRVRYTIGGCTSEVTDVDADGHRTRTIAIEAEDAAAVIAAVRGAGLGGYVNTAYPRGLRAVIAGEPPRYAVIDVGTNSVKFHVGERGPDGSWRRVVDRAELTRLGEGLEQTGEIGSDALDRTTDAIAGMVDEAKAASARAIAAVGTAGLRIARNGDAVVAEVRRRAGIEVEIISGEEESRLAYLAAKQGIGLADGSLVVFDTGGGSSQFTVGSADHVDDRFSVDVGAVRFTERFGLAGAVSSDVVEEALAAISADLERLDRRPHPDALVGMGGAITNMTAVRHGMATYDPDVVQGTVLDRAEVDRQLELYRTRDAEARRTIVGLQPKRADVILAGACIVRTVMEKLGSDSLTVSDRGLRHGVLAERFGSAQGTN